MSLNKTQLKADLGVLFDATLQSNTSADQARTDFINALADAIERYVKSAQVNYTNGLTAGSTPVTGTYNGSLS